MVSLWGSNKKGKDGEDDGQDANSDMVGAASSHSQTERVQTSRDSFIDPDERTRLLAHHQVPGYLSPDDPAVSPYNLWTVRAVRWFEVFFLFITCLWWVLLFISIFISPPHMHSRGSGFSDVAFTTLTVGNLLVALIFFAVPSAAMGILSMAISLLLLIDMILILSIARIREQEGWVGIASVIWAAVIGLYNIIANKTVKWGKAEEEERLTGRQETKRSVKEWLAVLISTIFMVLFLAITILLTATLALRSRDTSLQAPGELYLVDGDKYAVHVHCIGNVTYNSDGKPTHPTVLLEGGYMPVEDSFEQWISSSHANGTISRYCYWDRPGLAWSDNAPSPHSAGNSADALTEALALKGEHGPYLLVSAGIGSIYSRVFASRNVQNIAGIMLIEGLHEDLLYQISGASQGFLLWARGMISPLGLDRLAGALFKGRSREDRVYGQSSYQGGKFIKNKLQENLVADSLTKTEVNTARHIQDPGVPLVIVSSSSHMARDKNWEEKQEALTKITNNLVAWVSVKGGVPRGSYYEELWRNGEGLKTLDKYLGILFAHNTTNGGKPDNSTKPGHGDKPNNGTQPGNGDKPHKGTKPGHDDKPGNGKTPDDGKKPDEGKKPNKGKKPDEGKRPDEGKKPDEGRKPGNGKAPGDGEKEIKQ